MVIAARMREKLKEKIDQAAQVLEKRLQRKITLDERRQFAAAQIAKMDKTILDQDGISTEGWVELMYPTS